MLYISRAAPKRNFRRRGKRPSYSTPQSILFTFLLLRSWFYVFLVNRLNVFGLQCFNNFLYVPVIVGLFDLIRLISFEIFSHRQHWQSFFHVQPGILFVVSIVLDIIILLPSHPGNNKFLLWSYGSSCNNSQANDHCWS